MKTSAKLLIVFIIALFVSAPVFGQRMMYKDRMNKMQQLNLTEAQQDRCAELRTNHQEKMIDLRSELQKSKLAFDELRRKGNYSRSDYLNATSEIGKIRDKIATATAGHRMDVYEILDDSQKEVWNKTDGRRGMGRGMMQKGTMQRGMMQGRMDCPFR